MVQTHETVCNDVVLCVIVLFLTDQEEQGKAEAQCSKLERNLKILEKKLKDHQDNMQAMRSDLALKEEEVTVSDNICPNVGINPSAERFTEMLYFFF